ncbi:MAG: Fic family protein [Desulfobacterales bacterium]|nr:Fic family protein [Desulfobacterales bacterium]
MKSLDRAFLEQQSIPLEFAGTLRLLGEYRGKQELFTRQTPQILKTLKEVAIVQSTESSNRIEGVIVDEKRLKPLLEKKTTPKNRSEAEVVGYRDVLAQIHTSYARFSITPETILKIHGDMLRLTDLPAGIWKNRDNTIEERLPDGRWITRFIPVSASETPYFLKELCDRFNRLWEERRIDRLLLIHAFVFDFLCIHPFTDGNGRVSRLLTVLLLHQAEYDVGRYISLERIIEESKETYYEALQRASENWHGGKHRILPWWEYSLGILIAAYKEFEDRVGNIRASRGAKTVWVREAIEHLPEEFSVGDLARSCSGVSRPMIRVILESLRNEGKLEVLGTGRGAKWRKT